MKGEHCMSVPISGLRTGLGRGVWAWIVVCRGTTSPHPPTHLPTHPPTTTQLRSPPPLVFLNLLLSAKTSPETSCGPRPPHPPDILMQADGYAPRPATTPQLRQPPHNSPHSHPNFISAHLRQQPHGLALHCYPPWLGHPARHRHEEGDGAGCCNGENVRRGGSGMRVEM